MSSRWDRLLDLKTLTLVDALMTEASKVMAETLLGDWPPAIEGLDEATGAEFASIFAKDSKRPPIAAFFEATKLARFDLQRDFEAFDDYVRNERWTEAGLGTEHKTAILFLTRWIVEEALSLGEATDGRVRRKDMVAAVDRLEKLLRPS